MKTLYKNMKYHIYSTHYYCISVAASVLQEHNIGLGNVLVLSHSVMFKTGLPPT